MDGIAKLTDEMDSAKLSKHICEIFIYELLTLITR